MNKVRHIRSLTAKEIHLLKKCMKTSDDARLRSRAHAVWLSHQGYTIDEIAKILGCHRNPVRGWFERYEAEGLQGLQDRNREGRPAQAGPEFQKALVQTVKTPPRNLGYSFASWSAGRLRDHMAKETAIRVSEGHLRQLLKKNGIVFRKPKHDLKAKQDPALYNQKKELLEFVKKTQWPRMLALSFCFWMSVISTFIRT